jgi:hypothetical protein
MGIEYIMKPNALDQSGETFRAQIVNAESFGPEELVDEVMRTNAGSSRPELASMEKAFEEAFAHLLTQGKFFHSPLLRLALSIRGTYQRGELPTSKHIHANAYAGPLLQQAAARAALSAGQTVLKWAITRVFDVSTGKADETLTIGRNIRIEGKGLELEGDQNPRVEFVDAQSHAALVTLGPEQLAVNTPSLLVLDVPGSLAPGVYQIQIVTQYTGGGKVKSPHMIRYDVALHAQVFYLGQL